MSVAVPGWHSMLYGLPQAPMTAAPAEDGVAEALLLLHTSSGSSPGTSDSSSSSSSSSSASSGSSNGTSSATSGGGGGSGTRSTSGCTSSGSDASETDCATSAPAPAAPAASAVPRQEGSQAAASGATPQLHRGGGRGHDGGRFAAPRQPQSLTRGFMGVKQGVVGVIALLVLAAFIVVVGFAMLQVSL